MFEYALSVTIQISYQNHSIESIKYSSEPQPLEMGNLNDQEGLLSTSLIHLEIHSFPHLKTFKSFQHLTALKNLVVFAFDEIQFNLPEEELPASLSFLSISGNDCLGATATGEDRRQPKDFSRVPHINIKYTQMCLNKVTQLYLLNTKLFLVYTTFTSFHVRIPLAFHFQSCSSLFTLLKKFVN